MSPIEPIKPVTRRHVAACCSAPRALLPRSYIIPDSDPARRFYKIQALILWLFFGGGRRLIKLDRSAAYVKQGQ